MIHALDDWIAEKCKEHVEWRLTYDFPGFVDVQEAIPAASSAAKPQAEEAVSQGAISEPVAQESLGGNGNSRKTSKKPRKDEKRTKKIYNVNGQMASPLRINRWYL